MSWPNGAPLLPPAENTLREQTRCSNLPMSVLMARQPPESEPHQSGLPPRIQLPDFRSFLSAAGQSEHPAPNQDPPLPPSSTIQQPKHSHRHLPSFGIHGALNPSLRQQQQSPPKSEGSPGTPRPVSGYRTGPPAVHPPQITTATSHTYTYAPLEAGRVPSYPAHPGYSDLRSPLHGQFHEASSSKMLVGEEIVEGKGLCYIYSDNTHCPKSINGDMVNPKWGTTKAGKPRKRLGQACNTCREKKIRCDPQVPKCTQCQKFGRECRFEQRSDPFLLSLHPN